MSLREEVSISYGFEVDIQNEECFDIMYSDEFELPKDFQIVYTGDLFSDNEDSTIICIKKSYSFIREMENNGVKYLKSSLLVIQPDWNEKLLNFAKELKMKKPKIGWHLASTIRP
jgi:hypothetical protein